MPKRAPGYVLVACLLLAFAASATAKTVDIPVHWSIQKGELSVSRVRLYLGPKIRKEMCTKNHAFLRAGNTIRVILYGAGNETITTFTYTKSDCQ